LRVVHRGDDQDVRRRCVLRCFRAETFLFEDIKPPQMLLEVEALPQSLGQSFIDGLGAFGDLKVDIGNDNFYRNVIEMNRVVSSNTHASRRNYSKNRVLPVRSGLPAKENARSCKGTRQAS
jgi:hypothetical protein